MIRLASDENFNGDVIRGLLRRNQVQAGQRMPGLFEVGPAVPIAIAIQDLLLIAECSLPDEWEGQVRYLPLR